MRLPLILLTVLIAAPSYAQGRLAWDGTDHDFGSVPEGEDPVHVFAFVNEGDEPVRLLEVRPACGCTTPQYTMGEIAPGGRGEITVTYGSTGRPGRFDKSIFVRAAGAEPSDFELWIRGDVVPATLEYGVAQGNVRFDTDDFDARTVPAGQPVSHTFRMQNAGERPIRIRGARTFRDGVDVAFPSTPVFPGDVVEITVSTANAEAVSSYGVLDLAVTLDTDDPEQPAKSLRVRGRIEEVAGSR